MWRAKRDRVCVIGAGLSGMSVLYQYADMETENRPEVVCYEKHDTWGGLWNLTWMNGTDSLGGICNGSMYKYMWLNVPKESIEVSSYTYKEHFGKAVPSFLPRATMLGYFEDLWAKKSKLDLKALIKLSHAVQYVRYNTELERFIVSVIDLKTETVMEEMFSHVIVAAGIFSIPNKPACPGIEDFQGKILHSKEFHDAREFVGQRILVIGGSFSAEDISMLLAKYGAKNVICSWHTQPFGVEFPKGIETRPPVKTICQHTIIFEDDSTADVDAIILCTGYLYRFPFMEECLKLKSEKSMYPDNLYKGLLWIHGGNNKLFYIGTQYPYYTLPMYTVQAIWIWRYITGQLRNEPKMLTEMTTDIQKWLANNNAIKNIMEGLVFQTEYMMELSELVEEEKQPYLKMMEVIRDHLRARITNFVTHRNQCYQSVHTGQMACELTPWIANFEEDLDKICTCNFK